MTLWGTGSNGAPGGPEHYDPEITPTDATAACPCSRTQPDLASSLVAWVDNDAKTQGVPIYALSGANEPDSCGIKSTASYSAAQLATWIEILGPAMAAIGVKNMAPETQNGCGFPSYFSAIQKDTAAWNAVGIFASHEYDVVRPLQPAIAAAGKEYWETEVDTGTAKRRPIGDGIASALLMARRCTTT